MNDEGLYVRVTASEKLLNKDRGTSDNGRETRTLVQESSRRPLGIVRALSRRAKEELGDTTDRRLQKVSKQIRVR
jgi:hypothetical protein